MAVVYILYSNSLDKFYIGSCLDLEKRISEHRKKHFKNALTSKSDDWEIYFSILNLSYYQARKIEQHIKNMKSKKYIQNLKSYPEMASKLIEKYAGSSR